MLHITRLLSASSFGELTEVSRSQFLNTGRCPAISKAVDPLCNPPSCGGCGSFFRPPTLPRLERKNIWRGTPRPRKSQSSRVVVRTGCEHEDDGPQSRTVCSRGIVCPSNWPASTRRQD